MVFGQTIRVQSRAKRRLHAGGQSQDYFDVHEYDAMCKTHDEAVCPGAALIDALTR
jgi:hypothetical protein